MVPAAIIRVSVVLTSIWLLGLAPVAADRLVAQAPAATRVFNVQEQQNQTVAQVIDRLAQANVVYLAETHAQVQDHQAQLEIVRSLHRSRRRLVIGMEMFQRPFQWALNDYLAGEITEPELLRRTEYQKRWGYNWELYAPILRFAREHKIPVVALNTPSEVTRQVARSGFDALTLKERQWIPPQSSILAEPEVYRQRIRQIYDEMHQGKGSSASFDRFFLAQVVWDETMAEQVATVLRQSPRALVVVLAGQGHVIYRDGIPNRVLRRVTQFRSTPPLQQAIVVLNPATDLKAEPATGDYFWYSP